MNSLPVFEGVGYFDFRFNDGFKLLVLKELAFSKSIFESMLKF